MGFRSNKVTFQELKNPTATLPEFSDILSKMRKRSVPPSSDIKDLEVKGWAPGNGILLPLELENCVVDSSLFYVRLVSCERKVPASLLAEHVKLEESVLKKAEGKEFLSKKEKSEIRDSVIERLAPQQPVSYSASEVVITRSGRVFTDATSSSKMDAVRNYLQDATGILFEPMTPEVRLLCKLSKEKLSSISNVTFSPEKPALSTIDSLGANCLTSWLWFSDKGGKAPDGSSLIFDGDVTLEADDEGALKVVLQKGVPSVARELNEALLAGKKLTKASLALVSSGQQVSYFSLNAEDFKISAFKPELSDDDENLSADQKFSTLITAAEILSDAVTDWLCLYTGWAEDDKIKSEWLAWTKERTMR